MDVVKINGKNYTISFIDTEDTIKNMIALEENTFTNYIQYKVYKPSNKQITVSLLQKEIKVSEDKLIATVNSLHEKWGISKSDIALEWIDKYRGGKIKPQDEDILKEINSTDFWNSTAINTQFGVYKKRKDDALEKLADLAVKESAFRVDYSKYEQMDTTKFLQDSVIIEYNITIDLDPLDAFNSLSLNDTIPFARLKTIDQVYYKLTKTLVPSKDWLDGEATLVFKIYRPGDKDGWGTATLNYNAQPDQNDNFTALLTIESTIGKNETSEDTLKNAIIDIFTDTTITINDRKEKGIKGVFAVPEMTISRDVFLDLVTNDPMISHYLYVDETKELSSQKGVLYLYYAPGDTESQILTVFLSERTASRSDVFYTSKELLLFTPYLNVRVSRALNLDQIERFKKAFSVILTVYNKKFASILKEYNELIPGFKEANITTVKKTVSADKRLKDLQTQDSELFIHGYPTSCERKRQPIPIKEKHAKKLGAGQVVNYPKGSTNFFVCSDENEYKFPGLMKNKLANAEQYAYLPCCYPNNQQTGNKQLNLYLKEVTKTKKSKTTNIVTKKAVGREKSGMLPRNIHYILHKSNTTSGVQYLRRGVGVGNNSFIETVLLALDPDYEKITTDAEKTAYVADFRNNLPSTEFSAVIQELYDTSSEKFSKDILDHNIVFDSKIYTGLLEAHYNCQIVVFIRSEQQPNGEYEIPRYTQGYLFRKLDPNVKTVLVYKHLGSRSDGLETPHYELIIKETPLPYKTNKNLTTWHYVASNGDKALIQDVYSYFQRTYQLYSIGIGRYKAIPTPPVLLADAKGQVIDRYGKSRGYVFKNNVFVATSPITPAYNIEIMEMPIKRATLEDVKTFVKKHNLTITTQDISDDKAIGVVIDLVDIPYAYIPFEPSAKLKKIKESKHLGFAIPTSEDILKKTLHNRKIADFLMQLLLYKFSLWYSDKSGTTKFKQAHKELEDLSLATQNIREKNLLLDMVEKYLKTELIVKPDHEYDIENVSRRLTLNNNFFKNNKLVVDSEKTAERLGYYIRFMITKNKSSVLRYSDRKFLDNYYTYADDFKQRQNQLIFVGGLSINNWVDTQSDGISNQVHNIPHSYLKEPFFYSHWGLNANKPVIFQNVKHGSLGRALAVAAKYHKESINIGYDPNPISTIDHTVYFIENGKLMKEGTSPLKVWRFKNNFYAALLIPYTLKIDV